MKTGDVVRLKSGSPKMTVVEPMGAWVRVCWYEDRKPNEAVYRAEMVCEALDPALLPVVEAAPLRAAK